MYLNSNNAIAEAEHLQLNVIMQTENGVFADVPDSVYHTEIRAHSKHSIEPALRSGVDYEYFTVNKKPKKTTQAMKDSTLLHLMTLEKAQLDVRYLIGKDFAKEYADHKLYFTNDDELSSFVAIHNREHSRIKNEVKNAVSDWNAQQKLTVKNDSGKIEYSDLPIAYQTANLSSRNRRKAIDAFIALVFLEIDLSIPTEEVLEPFTSSLFDTVQSNCSSWFDDAFITKYGAANNRDKARLLSALVNEKKDEFSSLIEQEQIAWVPKKIQSEYLTKTEVQKCIKTYQAFLKSNVELIDESLSLEEQIDELDNCGTTIKFTRVHLTQLKNVGSKKSNVESGVWLASEVAKLVSEIYNETAILESVLISEELAEAESSGRELITHEQFQHAERIVDAVFNCPEAAAILNHKGNEYELAMLWNDKKSGHLCKGKVDILNRSLNIMADMKFVNSVDYDKMSRDSSAYNYHLQHATYEGGFNTIMDGLMVDGEPEQLEGFVFIVVEKDAPKLGAEDVKPIRVRVVRFEREDVDRAKQLFDGAITRVSRWFAKKEFEGFKGIETVVVPVFQKNSELKLIEKMRKEDSEYQHELSCASNELDDEALMDELQVDSGDETPTMDVEQNMKDAGVVCLPDSSSLFGD